MSLVPICHYFWFWGDSLVRRLLRKDPSARCSAAEALQAFGPCANSEGISGAVHWAKCRICRICRIWVLSMGWSAHRCGAPLLQDPYLKEAREQFQQQPNALPISEAQGQPKCTKCIQKNKTHQDASTCKMNQNASRCIWHAPFRRDIMKCRQSSVVGRWFHDFAHMGLVQPQPGLQCWQWLGHSDFQLFSWPVGSCQKHKKYEKHERDIGVREMGRWDVTKARAPTRLPWKDFCALRFSPRAVAAAAFCNLLCVVQLVQLVQVQPLTSSTQWSWVAASTWRRSMAQWHKMFKSDVCQSTVRQLPVSWRGLPISSHIGGWFSICQDRDQFALSVWVKETPSFALIFVW